MNQDNLKKLQLTYGAAPVDNLHVVKNSLYASFLEYVQKKRLPIIGVPYTKMQVPLEKIPSMTGQFPSLAVEMAYYMQLVLAQKKFSLPPDYYLRHTQALDTLYMLNTSASTVVKTSDLTKHSVRTASFDVIRSFPEKTIENFSQKRLGSYLLVDARSDLEKDSLRSVELRPTATHQIRLYNQQLPVRGNLLIPCFCLEGFTQRILQILKTYEVSIQYQMPTGKVVSIRASLRQDFLQKHYGKSEKTIQAQCRNAYNETEITLVGLLEGSSKARMVTLNILGICSIVKA